jgi:hypothetical protein
MSRLRIGDGRTGASDKPFESRVFLYHATAPTTCDKIGWAALRLGFAEI